MISSSSAARSGGRAQPGGLRPRSASGSAGIAEEYRFGGTLRHPGLRAQRSSSSTRRSSPSISRIRRVYGWSRWARPVSTGRPLRTNKDREIRAPRGPLQVGSVRKRRGADIIASRAFALRAGTRSASSTRTAWSPPRTILVATGGQSEPARSPFRAMNCCITSNGGLRSRCAAQEHRDRRRRLHRGGVSPTSSTGWAVGDVRSSIRGKEILGRFDNDLRASLHEADGGQGHPESSATPSSQSIEKRADGGAQSTRSLSDDTTLTGRPGDAGHRAQAEHRGAGPRCRGR